MKCILLFLAVLAGSAHAGTVTVSPGQIRVDAQRAWGMRFTATCGIQAGIVGGAWDVISTSGSCGELAIVVAGDTLSAGAQVVLNVDGCPLLTNVELAPTQIVDVLYECEPTPVESKTWGTIKQLYRR